MPQVTIQDLTRDEGSDGAATDWAFLVDLSNASERPVSISYQTADGSATVANGDYAPKSGVLNVPLGASRDTIRIPVVADTKDENDETFLVVLTSSIGADIADSSAVGTIVDDDGTPSIARDRGPELHQRGRRGFTPMKVTVALSNASAIGSIEVDYHTEDGTATIANDDYVPTSGHLVFSPRPTARAS